MITPNLGPICHKIGVPGTGPWALAVDYGTNPMRGSTRGSTLGSKWRVQAPGTGAANWDLTGRSRGGPARFDLPCVFVESFPSQRRLQPGLRALLRRAHDTANLRGATLIQN